ELGAQAARGEVLDNGVPMPDIAPAAVFLQVRRDPSKRLWWNVRLAAFAQDGRPRDTEIETPGYAVVGARAGERISCRRRLFLQGTNLLDDEHPSGADEIAALAPGRNLLASLRVEL